MVVRIGTPVSDRLEKSSKRAPGSLMNEEGEVKIADPRFC